MVTRRLPQPIGDQVAFLRQWREESQTTGAVAPSSRFLADALTRPMRRRIADLDVRPAAAGALAASQPLRVLELGPGTGAVTRRIVELLRPDDRLDLVELNDQFAAILEKKFREDARFQPAAEGVRIHVCAVQDFEADGSYDFIVSGLPLNNFPPDAVRQIFDICFRLLSSGGVLSYFEYMVLRRLRRLFARKSRRARMAALDAVLDAYLNRYRERTDHVLANVPPAWVYHLRAQAVV